MDDLTREFIAESREGLERMERCLTELERRPGDGELVAEIFRSVHTIKGTTGFLGFDRLETLAHAGEGLLGELREGKVTVSSNLISGLLKLMDGLRAILDLIERTGTEGVRARDDDRELIALLSELRLPGGESAGERFPERTAGPAVRGAVRLAEAKVEQPMGAATSMGEKPANDPASAEKTLRVDVEVLNRMMNLVGDLVLTRNQILKSSASAEEFPELARRLDSVTAELRESVMQARMQPVGHVFGRFPRMVRELARACGRQVRIEFEGRETGLDKSLLEAIRDPLTHAVRNAVDHGIEPAEERVKAGKPAEGLVRLRAFQQNGSVLIEVIDDGAGIPLKRVLAKALERGLVTEEQAAAMSEREILEIVFAPGFTTAETVTNVSGRGVGLDVVRANIERVGGSVQLETRAGAGTTMRLRVPLTLAIVPALVVKSGGQSFAVPQGPLMELVYVARSEVATALERMGRTELYRLRGALLPLVWLDRLLGLERAHDVRAEGFYIAVMESEGSRFGLVVDELMAPEEIVVKPLSAVLREIGLFSGATVLGNGSLALILDVAATRVRAGIRTAETVVRTHPAVPQRRGEAEVDVESAMVVFELVGGQPVAIPMSEVERIEAVAAREIEFAGGRPVLQCRGELLPLEDEGGVLQELGLVRECGTERGGVPAPGMWVPESWADAGAGFDGERELTVMICLRAGAGGVRRVGMVVRRVLDVSAGTLLREDEMVCPGRVAMVKDRVTTVHREAVRPAEAPVLQEVA